MRLQRIQNSCYIFSFCIRRFETGISEKIQQTGQLKLEKLRKLHLLSIMHKVLTPHLTDSSSLTLSEIPMVIIQFDSSCILYYELKKICNVIYTKLPLLASFIIFTIFVDFFCRIKYIQNKKNIFSSVTFFSLIIVF